MACQFEFDRSNSILRCKFEGAVTDESLREYHQEAASMWPSLMLASVFWIFQM